MGFLAEELSILPIPGSALAEARYLNHYYAQAQRRTELIVHNHCWELVRHGVFVMACSNVFAGPLEWRVEHQHPIQPVPSDRLHFLFSLQSMNYVPIYARRLNARLWLFLITTRRRCAQVASGTFIVLYMHVGYELRDSGWPETRTADPMGPA
jgi:hypothetical protein